MNRILVTGATGQIGSELIPALRERYGSENVIAAGHKTQPDKELLEGGIFCCLDVRDFTAVEKIDEGNSEILKQYIDEVLNLAGQEQAKNIFGSVFDLVNNASSYEEIQEKLAKNGVKTDKIEKILEKIIFISEIWGRLHGID